MKIAVLALLVAFLLLGFLAESDEILAIVSLLSAPFAVIFLMFIVKQRKFYTTIFFGTHLAMYIFTLYVLVNRELVIPSPEFSFSVFTAENLRAVLMGFATTLITITFVSLALCKRPNMIHELDLHSFFMTLIGRLEHLGQGTVLLLIAISFMGSVGLFLTGPTVLTVPYAINLLEFPFPTHVLTVPQLLSALALGIMLFKSIVQERRDASHQILLQAARINFVVSPILCLMVAGARGFTTFMWLSFAFLELYTATKKKTGKAWGLIFLVLGFFAYSAWPCLRGNLSSLPIDEALKQGLEYALWMDQDMQFADVIDLSRYWMIGQSLFHFLYVIQLEADGNSLAGATFVNLIPQVLPEFLDGVSWNRPLNDNLILGNYYMHGGGFLAIANAYWNGGMLAMAGFVACLSTLFVYFDSHLQKTSTSTLYRWAYIAVVPIITVQLFYGIQGLARPLELLFLIVVLEKVFTGKKSPQFAGSRT